MMPVSRSFRRSRLRSSPCLAALTAVCIAIFYSAQAQIEPVERSQIPPGPYRIAGTVVNVKGGNAIARARVIIADAKHRPSAQSVITGDDGRFEFHVPAGKYSLDGAKRGYIAASYNQHDQFSTAIVTGADLDTEHLVLRLAPNAVLTGTVLDEFGEPVRNAQVAVYRENHVQGLSRISRYSASSTDDQGRYEVTPLDEGTYFVCAKASPWYAVHPSTNVQGATNSPAHVDASLDVVYPITYYGDATEAEDATPIPVRGGDRLVADIHLNPVPSLHLIVHTPEDGSHGINLPVLQKPAFDGFEQVATSNIQMISPGVFEVTGVAAGRYSVRVPDSNGQMKEPTEINLSGGGELDVSSGSSTSKIKATVQIEGAAGIPAQFQIALRDGKGRVNVAEVDTKGGANLADVIPGKYDVVVFSPTPTQSYSVVRIASEAGMISGHSLNVPPGAQLSISLTLVGSSVTVEGFAKRAGKATSGAMIVLVPKDPEANHDRFRRDQSDQDGSFSLPNVIPGSYTVLAIEDGWDLDWSQPAVLAQYVKEGQALEVMDRSPSTLHLPGAVEVQPK
jgi:hypothetical protein